MITRDVLFDLVCIRPKRNEIINRGGLRPITKALDFVGVTFTEPLANTKPEKLYFGLRPHTFSEFELNPTGFGSIQKQLTVSNVAVQDVIISFTIVPISGNTNIIHKNAMKFLIVFIANRIERIRSIKD